MGSLKAKLLLLPLPFALFALGRASAQRPDLVYQSRGQYREGIRTTSATGPTLDLIAALVDYQESRPPTLPQSFRALFYLPDSQAAFLAIREVKPRYFYWLGDLPPTRWQARRPNEFVWSTDTVIKSLDWEDDGPLGLNDLGAIVRLGSDTPSPMEAVAPVALYYSHPPEKVDGYRFIFLPSAEMRIEYHVYPDGGGSPLESQPVAAVPANAPYPVTLNVVNWPEGWYRAVLSGYATADNSKVPAVVRFYHSRRLGK